MGLIKSGAIETPQLPTENVQVDALGGEVKVRSLRLSERLAFERQIAKATKTADAPDADWMSMVPGVLEITVLDATDRPVFSRESWEIFGAANLGAAIGLFNVAWRLSGMPIGESPPEKN